MLTVVAAVCAAVLISLGGCKKYPEYTAEKPCYTSPDYSNITFKKDFVFRGVMYDELGAYKEFVNYYKNDFKEVCQDEFYILNLGEPKNYFIGDRSEYSLYATSDPLDEIENFYIGQYVSIYDKKLGGSLDGKYNTEEGESNWSIMVSIISVPVEHELDGEFILEFGKTNNTMFDKYVNIYCENVCVATCEYRTAVKIPLEWFENYFKNNLIYGENL